MSRYFFHLQDASIKRLSDIDANILALKKKSGNLKPHQNTQKCPKKTAVVNPLPLNKSQKPKCKNDNETELSSNNDSRTSNEEVEDEPETSTRTSMSGTEEGNGNEVTFPSPKKSPRRSPKKKVEIKCK